MRVRGVKVPSGGPPRSIGAAFMTSDLRCLWGSVLTCLFIVGVVSADTGGLVPPLAVRDTQAILDIAGIDDAAQQEVISLLLNDFEAGVRLLNERIAGEIEATDAASFVDSMRIFSDARAELDQQFGELVRSMGSMMTPPQQQAFESFWKSNHRATRLRGGRFPGEQTNLDPLLVDAGAFGPAFHDRVAKWQHDIDSALLNRYSFDVTGVPVLIDLIMTGKHDEALRMGTAEIDARGRVRLVNDRAIEEIAVLMPPEAGSAFREAALAAGYPQVFRRDTVERMVASACGDAETPEVDRDWLVDLERQYGIARMPLRERLLKAIRDGFGKRWLAPMQRRVGEDVSSESLDLPRVEALLAVRGLEREYLAAICERLGPDRCAAVNGGRYPLPDPPPGWNPPFPAPRDDDPVQPPPDAGLENQDLTPEKPDPGDDQAGPPPDWSERGSATSHPGAEPDPNVPDPDPPPS